MVDVDTTYTIAYHFLHDRVSYSFIRSIRVRAVDYSSVDWGHFLYFLLWAYKLFPFSKFFHTIIYFIIFFFKKNPLIILILVVVWNNQWKLGRSHENKEWASLSHVLSMCLFGLVSSNKSPNPSSNIFPFSHLSLSTKCFV